MALALAVGRMGLVRQGVNRGARGLYTSACPLSLEAWHGHLRYSHGLERWFTFTGRTRSGISAWGIYKNDGIQDLEYVEDIDLVEGTDPPE